MRLEESEVRLSTALLPGLKLRLDAASKASRFSWKRDRACLAGAVVGLLLERAYTDTDTNASNAATY